jgi:hypothetical protein
MSNLADFFEELPIVRSVDSPWYAYVRDVYQAPELPLPLDMREFSFFAMPKRETVWLPGGSGVKPVMWQPPFDTCGAVGHHGPSERCVRESCIADGWTRAGFSPPDRGPVLGHICGKNEKALNCPLVPWSYAPAQMRREASRLGPPAIRHAVFKANIQWSSMPHSRWARSRHDMVAAQYWLPLEERRPVPNHSWIEVHRWGFTPAESSFTEGMGYGCWAWPLLPPRQRGTGVFINVGRTLVFKTRTLAFKWCPESLPAPPHPPGFDNLWAKRAHDEGYDSIQILRCAQHCCARVPHASAARDVRNRVLVPRRGRAALPTTSPYPAARYLRRAASPLACPFACRPRCERRGYSNQPELVVSRQPCLSQKIALGACFPEGIEMRTGPNAELPCKCVEYDNFGRPTVDPYKRSYMSVSNCDGTRPRVLIGKGRRPTRTNSSLASS